jgi:hypothetical protein
VVRKLTLIRNVLQCTMTTLIYVFYSPLESHRSTRFGVFSVHHLQETPEVGVQRRHRNASSDVIPKVNKIRKSLLS